MLFFPSERRELLFFTLENDFFLKMSEKKFTLTGEKGLGRVKIC
jgi:hypothetical protein